MNILKLSALAVAVACIAAPAVATAATPATWVGTANYDVETVGPFNTYDFASAGVLLIDPMSNSTSTANGYYQSFVDRHFLDFTAASAPGLNSSYEITVVANFTSTLSANNAYAVNGGSFALYLGTGIPNHNFGGDSGFNDGTQIMSGTVIGGGGYLGGDGDGSGTLRLQVTGYDQSVYQPDTIAGGKSIFSLELLSNSSKVSITSVQGHNFDTLSGDQLYAADGKLVLAVPEPESYAMLLAGLGLMGAIARRRIRR